MLSHRLRASGVFEGETSTYINAMSVRPTPPRQVLINDLIKGLKYAGVWSRLSWVSILAAHDGQAGRLNAKNPAQSLTAVSAPTFTVDRGFAGNGSSAYLDAGQTFAAGGLYAQNSASFAIYANDSGAGPYYLGDGDNTTANGYFISSTPTDVQAYINGGGGVSAVVPNPRGMLIASRTSPTLLTAYRNGASLGTNTASTTGVPTGNVRILQVGGVYGRHRVAFACWGAGLSGVEVTALNSLVTTFLTAIGANA